MHLLETGLHHYGVEVRILCLESIASCGARLEALQSSQTLSDILEHFLKVYIHTYIHIVEPDPDTTGSAFCGCRVQKGSTCVCMWREGVSEVSSFQ